MRQPTKFGCVTEYFISKKFNAGKGLPTFFSNEKNFLTKYNFIHNKSKTMEIHFNPGTPCCRVFIPNFLIPSECYIEALWKTLISTRFIVLKSELTI